MNTTVSLYVVKGVSGNYFAGFDTAKGQANFVEDPRKAKTFTNKYDIKLRPEEQLVEMAIDLDEAQIKFSEPFRPQRRVKA
jgi:hypothetical protein